MQHSGGRTLVLALSFIVAVDFGLAKSLLDRFAAEYSRLLRRRSKSKLIHFPKDIRVRRMSSPLDTHASIVIPRYTQSSLLSCLGFLLAHWRVPRLDYTSWLLSIHHYAAVCHISLVRCRRILRICTGQAIKRGYIHFG